MKICKNTAIFEPNFHRKNIFSYKNHARELKIDMQVSINVCQKSMYINFFRNLDFLAGYGHTNPKKLAPKIKNVQILTFDTEKC